VFAGRKIGVEQHQVIPLPAGDGKLPVELVDVLGRDDAGSHHVDHLERARRLHLREAVVIDEGVRRRAGTEDRRMLDPCGRADQATLDDFVLTKRDALDAVPARHVLVVRVEVVHCHARPAFCGELRGKAHARL
jgi:hypothetical protein